MAKAKSKKITIEDALVPVEEQPYEVPENWCWIHLLDAFDNVTDSKKKLPTKEYQEEGEYSIVDQGQEFVGGYTDCKDMVYDGDMPVIIFGDHTRCVKYVDFPFVQGADGVKVLSPKKFWDSKAFYYAIQSVEIPNMGYRRHYPLFKNFSIPVPPLPEQQRIVEQIESLFSKLDEAKEKAQGILNSFDDTWSAITYAAFTGRLTEKWRERNGKETDWKEYTLQGVCAMKITDGTHQTPTYCEKEDGGVPFISAKDVTSKTICWDDIKYIVPELHEELYARIAPQIDDVLLAKNGTTGVAAIVDTDKVFDIYVTLAVLRPDKDIIVPRYLYNIVNSPVCKDQFNSHLTGIGVPNLHLRDIKDVKIMVPDKDEQIEVVRLVDRLWDTYLTAYETAKGVVESIDIMKKSILAKAFRGELGTNDPSEESSIELIKQIIE